MTKRELIRDLKNLHSEIVHSLGPDSFSFRLCGELVTVVVREVAAVEAAELKVGLLPELRGRSQQQINWAVDIRANAVKMELVTPELQSITEARVWIARRHELGWRQDYDG